jgi:hypothetical protein
VVVEWWPGLLALGAIWNPRGRTEFGLVGGEQPTLSLGLEIGPTVSRIARHKEMASLLDGAVMDKEGRCSAVRWERLWWVQQDHSRVGLWQRDLLVGRCSGSVAVGWWLVGVCWPQPNGNEIT